MANTKNFALTKVVIPCRISFANIWEPKSVNGGDEKYSVSCVIAKTDEETIGRIKRAVEAAKEEGRSKWNGKIPANLKLPLRDGDMERPDDETYKNTVFVNAASKEPPQIVDRRKNPVTDHSTVYSGCYCNVSINFYAFNVSGNRGIAAGLGNIQFVSDGERLSGRASAETDFEDLGEIEIPGEAQDFLC